MKYAEQISINFLAAMFGELFRFPPPRPVPAGVYGLFSLLGALCADLVKLSGVDDVGA